MTKQEAVIKSYGDLFDEAVKIGNDRFLDNGYIILMDERSTDIHWNNLILKKHPFDNHLYRPEILTGIENNNGWIKIESESDLPKEYGACHVKYENRQTVAWFNGVEFLTLAGKKFRENAVTHYQVLSKPNPPIY